MKKRVIIALFMVMLCVPLVWAQGDDLEKEIATQRKKLEELHSQQAKIEQELNKLLKSEKNLVQEIEKLDRQIAQLEKDITFSTRKLNDLEKQRKALEREVALLSQSITTNQEKVKMALVRVYRYDFGVSFWEFFLESGSPAEWEEKWYLLRRYTDFESTTINQYFAQRKELSNTLKEIQTRIQLENTLKEKLALENKRLAQLKETREAMLQKTKADREEFRKTREKLAQAQKEVENMIVTLQKKLAAKKTTLPASVTPAKKGRLYWPVQGGKVVRSFGESKDPRYGINFYNPGIDIAAPLGTPVFAASSGVVLLAQDIRGYGKTIVLEHGQDVVTVYAHLQEMKVAAGQEVKGGEVIGLLGNTGLTDGPILHFEVRVGDTARAENPLQWLE